MPANTPDEWRLSELNRTVERLEAEAAQLQADAATQAKAASRAAWRRRYLQLARAVRRPTAAWELWPIGLIVVGGLFAGFLALAVTSLVTGSNAAALLAFLLVAAGASGAAAALLFRPSREALPTALASAEADGRLAAATARETADKLAAARNQLAAAVEERRDLMASGQVQRAALLQRPWKAMTEVEWEDFVVEVCRTLGATVERPPRQSAQDARLVAHFAERRVAIVAHGEGHVVNSKTVQDALAGQRRHGCNAAAVVINRRFTGAAQDFARHNGCTLIGVDEFPDFVMGKLRL